MAYTKYSLTPANNTAAPPDGAPEGMLPSAVNDTMRDMMAQIRDVGDGVRDGTYTMTTPKITGGTITGVTLTGNTFSSPVISGGTINSATVGATTASTGAFTTLTSNGATTFTANTASTSTTTGTTVITGGLGVSGRINSANFDGIVGANTAAAGSFTTVTASGNISGDNAILTGDVRLPLTGKLSFNGSASSTYMVGPSNGIIDWYLASSQVMRLNSTGLGIGTSSPSALLECYSATTAKSIKMTVGNTTQASFVATNSRDYIQIAVDGTATYLDAGTVSPLLFLAGNAERMRIDTSGNLLVGQTSVGIINSNGYTLNASLGVLSQNHDNTTTSGANYTLFGHNGSIIGSITQNGTTGVLYNVVSDQRLKTNIVDALLGNIDSIKVRSFDWIADGSHQEYGMIAQELIEVAPYAVNKPENPDEMMGVDYSKLVPMMIKEIQDLKQRIVTLENK